MFVIFNFETKTRSLELFSSRNMMMSGIKTLSTYFYGFTYYSNVVGFFKVF